MSSTSLPAARLSAIVAADAAGYSRLMAIDDRLTIELLDAGRDVFRAACAEHHGRVVDMAGDSVLLAFGSAVSALRCALAVQERLGAPAGVERGTLRLPFRIGVHLGDVIEKSDGSVYGDGVNIAARLQALAEPDEVMVSQAIRDLVGARPVARFEDAGEHRLKNVAEPMHAWRAWPPEASSPRRAATAASGPLRFGDRFELQPSERRLLVDGEPAILGARAFDLLVELARMPGAVRTKAELLRHAWPGGTVEETQLHEHIAALRKVLGGATIETIPGRGHRFVLPAQTRAGADATVASPALPASSSTSQAPAPQPPEAATLRTNLPATLPLLVGRAEDQAALDTLIGQHRLVSLIGAGGMGKTTIALHLTAARRDAYRHGVCWVELAGVTSDAALPEAIASAIGVDIGRGDALAGLCATLAPLTMLLALDNAEQVVEGVARLAQAVLDRAPGVRFVVTTQAPLKLPAERAYRIGPLTLPQGPLPAAQAVEFGAVALFVERAQAADARFALTDANAPAVIELCRQLDGLALAIELAAARAPMLGVQRLASSMGDRLRVLNSSRNRIAPARQQTLRAALEWSHSFLEPRERAVFRRMAVFAGSASLTMVQQVVPDAPDASPGRDLGDLGEPLDEWATLDALALLVERSLVVALTPDDASEPRYRLLETRRVFAREKLQQAGEEAALRRRHFRACAAWFDRAWEEAQRGTIGLEAWRHAMAADLDNGREALIDARAADDPVAAVQIACVISWVLARGAHREGVALAEALEPHIDRLDDDGLLARACQVFALAFADTRPQRAVEALRRCVARMRPVSAGDPSPARWPRFFALALLSSAEGRADLEASEAALVEARALADPAWPPIRTIALVMAESFWARHCHDAAALLHWMRRRVVIEEACGNSTATALSNVVDAELRVGLTAQAVATGTALVASLAGGRNERGLLFARLNLSAALLSLDDAARARAELQAGWVQASKFGLEAFYADYLALLAALEGRFDAAARLAGYAQAENARVGERMPNEAAAHARAVRLARAALGDDAFERGEAAGASMREDDVAAIAFADGVAR